MDFNEDGDITFEFLGFVALVAIGLFVLILSLSPARSHSWYPAACCSDRDCAPIRASAVSRVGNEYVITLRRGEHPMLDASQDITVRKIATHLAEPSRDREYHVCLSPIDARILCFFIPLSG